MALDTPPRVITHSLFQQSGWPSAQQSGAVGVQTCKHMAVSNRHAFMQHPAGLAEEQSAAFPHAEPSNPLMSCYPHTPLSPPSNVQRPFPPFLISPGYVAVPGHAVTMHDRRV